MQCATAMPAERAAYHDKYEPVQNRLFRSLRVWSMYADLEESLGSFEVRGRAREGGGGGGGGGGRVFGCEGGAGLLIPVCHRTNSGQNNPMSCQLCHLSGQK